MRYILEAAGLGVQKLDRCTYHFVNVFGASLSTNACTTTISPFGVWPIRTGTQSSGRKCESGEDGKNLHDCWRRLSLELEGGCMFGL